jgi:hypothetical protein
VELFDAKQAKLMVTNYQKGFGWAIQIQGKMHYCFGHWSQTNLAIL